MEEVYVIKLKGVPSTSTSETSTTAAGTNDLIRGSILGLGVLHVTFGLLIVVFGALRTTMEQEPSATAFGTLFGPVFMATGISAVLSWRRPHRKLKSKVFFGLSLFSCFSSAVFIALCCVGVVSYHSVPRIFGDSPHVTANAIVAAIGEFVVALLSVFTSGSSSWKCFQCGVFRPSVVRQQSGRRKVIVKTNIVGGTGLSALDEDVIRHVSPHCVISLRATDEQREVIKRVEEYVRDLHTQDELSFTFSDPSTLQEEQDLGVDSQNWRNEVLSLKAQQNLQCESHAQKSSTR